MSNINWAKNLITHHYKNFIKNNGADLNKNGKIETNEKLTDANNNGVKGDHEDFLAYIDKNATSLRKSISFLEYGQELSIHNRIHSLLWLESKLPYFTQQQTQEAYAKLSHLLNKTKKILNYPENKKLPIEEKILIAYKIIENEGYNIINLELPTFTRDLLQNELDCDTLSFIILALAEELKDKEPEWNNLAHIDFHKHVILTINGKYFDIDGIKSRQYYVKDLNLPTTNESRYFIPLKGNDVESIFYNNRGIAYSLIKDQARAIQDYDKSITINPNNEDAYVNRGVAYLSQGNILRAIQDFNRAIKINPNNEDAYFNCGVAYSYLGEKQTAIDHYDIVLKLNPRDKNAIKNRKIASISLKRQKITADIESYQKQFNKLYGSNGIVSGLKDIKDHFVKKNDDYYISYHELLLLKGKISINADTIIEAIEKDNTIFKDIVNTEKEGYSRLFIKWGTEPSKISYKDLYSISRGISYDGNIIHFKIMNLIKKIKNQL